MYNAGTAEEGLRQQTEVDCPGEIAWHQNEGTEAVIVTGRPVAAARAGGYSRTCAGRAGLKLEYSLPIQTQKVSEVGDQSSNPRK
jgi:hypothetical protein